MNTTNRTAMNTANRRSPGARWGGTALWAVLCTACMGAQKPDAPAAQPLPVSPAHPAPVETMVLTGMVVVYGSEPHTYICITTGDGTSYAVTPAATARTLRELQGIPLVFTVRLSATGQLPGIQHNGTVEVLDWQIPTDTPEHPQPNAAPQDTPYESL